MDFIFLLYISSSLLSGLFAGMPGGSEWKAFRGMFVWIIFGWIISRCSYSNNEKKYIIIFTVCATIPPLIFGLIEIFFLQAGGLQLNSVGHSNHSAIYLSIISSALLGVILTTDISRTKHKIMFGLGLGLYLLFLFSIIIAESRAAFLIVFLSGFMIPFLTSIKKPLKFLVWSFLATTIIGVFVFNTGILQKQIHNQNKNNVLAYREKVWAVSIEVANLYPALGIGNGNWKFITSDQIKKSVESRGEIFNDNNYFFAGHSHSLYLSALVERGWLGLVALILFMSGWFICLMQSFMQNKYKSNSTSIFISSLSAFIATFGIGFVNSTFHHENALIALLFFGLHLNTLRKKI